MPSTHVLEGDDGNVYMVSRADGMYPRLAAQLSAVFGQMITALDPDDPYAAGYRGFMVKETETHRIEVYAMLVNYRLATVPKGRLMPVPDRFWCYDGLDAGSLITAVQAAIEWDGAVGSEPSEWVRNGQTGEQRRSMA